MVKLANSKWNLEDQRFSTDVAGELSNDHKKQLERKELVFQTKRERAKKTEEHRWERVQKESEQNEKKFEAQKQANPNKKNISSVQYDVFTLGYDQTDAGKMTKYKDDLVKVTTGSQMLLISTVSS